MFDHYSQMTAHARGVAFLHPRAQTTWQDAAREDHDTDLDSGLPGLSSAGPRRSLGAGLGALFHQLRLSLSGQSAGQAGSQEPGLALGR